MTDLVSTSVRDRFSLQRRVAVVTGASRGLGRSIAGGLASCGATVALVARTADDLRRAVDDLGKDGESPPLAVTGDVAADGGADAIVHEVVASLGRVDVLVNAAGTMLRGAIEQSTLADFDRVVATNARGVWAMCRAVVPAMRGAGGGAIVNVASTAGFVGLSERSAYAASKGAVVQITRALAVELAPWRIRVNAVAPGPFKTDMTADNERIAGIVERLVPMQRMADPSEIAGAVVFLASDASSFTTGAVVPVDGGWLAQ